ncbi:alpha/beta hydrolase [Streptomyces niger]|uniref:alpha/beta hydrolase n=1 Tax=Streptomyces niger TaxID=66373 RepID=UPI00069AE273|nr:alpha/beta hydrolase [Streptomyces niger]
MFTFDVDPKALLRERTRQLVSLGIPASTVADAEHRIDDMWGTGPTSWVPVWTQHAERAARQGHLLLASLCWGAARFPVSATPERRAAHEQQLDWYLKATERFPVRFQRKIVEVPDGRHGTTAVPLHLFRRRQAAGGRPRGVLLLSGGVDTWKMDLHRLAVSSALATGLLVAAADMPGTGESAVPLTHDADAVLGGVVEQLRVQYRRPVGFLGLSFGGHWAAKLALQGRVDAAVDIGGPTGVAVRGDDELLAMPHGMPGIVGNALGLDRQPDGRQAAELLARFSLRDQDLLRSAGAAPLLAVNGADDQYVPLLDTTGLAHAPNTTVWVIRNATHCAPERFLPLMAAAWGWLLARLTPSHRTHLSEKAARLPLRPFLMPPAEAAARALRVHDGTAPVGEAGRS